MKKAIIILILIILVALFVAAPVMRKQTGESEGGMPTKKPLIPWDEPKKATKTVEEVPELTVQITDLSSTPAKQLTFDPNLQAWPTIAHANDNFYIAYTSREHGQDKQIYLEKYDSNFNQLKRIHGGKADDESGQADNFIIIKDDKIYHVHTAVFPEGEMASVHLTTYDLDLNRFETMMIPIEKQEGQYEAQVDPTILYANGKFIIPYLNTERSFRVRNRIQLLDQDLNPIKKVDIDTPELLESQMKVSTEASRSGTRQRSTDIEAELKKKAEHEARQARIDEEKTKQAAHEAGTELETGEDATEVTGKVAYLNVATAPGIVAVGDNYYVVSNILSGFNVDIIELDSDFNVNQNSLKKLTSDTSLMDGTRTILYHKDHLYVFYSHQETDSSWHIYCQKLDLDLNVVSKYKLTEGTGMQTYPGVIVISDKFYMVYADGPLETVLDEDRDLDVYLKVFEGI